MFIREGNKFILAGIMVEIEAIIEDKVKLVYLEAAGWKTLVVKKHKLLEILLKVA